MLLIPYKKFTLNIYRPKLEVEAQLAARVVQRRIVRRRSFFKSPDPATPFEGVVENGRFNINRLINYKNSFLPYLIGEIQDEFDATRVIVTMRLNHFVLGFMLLWLILFTSVFGVNNIGSTEGVWTIPTFLLFMLLFYAVLMGFFNWEANKAGQFLEEVWGEKLEF